VKKGQITIFVIVGIIIIFLAVLLFFILNDYSYGTLTEDFTLSTQERKIKNNVEDFIIRCANDLLIESIYTNGLGGGYFEQPNEPDPLFYHDNIIPTYVVGGDIFFPTIEIIEKEINKYVESNIEDCTNEFDIIQSNKHVVVEDPTVSVSIKKNLIELSMKYNTRITFENLIIKPRDTYNTNVKFSYLDVHDIIKNIVSKIAEDKEHIPFGYLTDLAEDNDLTFSMEEFEESVVTSIQFKKGPMENIPYIHNFAFSKRIIKPIVELEEFPEILSKTAFVGIVFDYQVERDLEESTFSDKTNLFDINHSTGEIKFIPTSDQIGKNLIEIEERNAEGITITSYLDLLIESSNQPPEIESFELMTFEMGQNYSFNIHADDPENDELSYRLESSLQNLFINKKSGEIKFEPLLGQEGYHSVNVFVSDSFGNEDRSTFTIGIQK